MGGNIPIREIQSLSKGEGTCCCLGRQGGQGRSSEKLQPTWKDEWEVAR